MPWPNRDFSSCFSLKLYLLASRWTSRPFLPSLLNLPTIYLSFGSVTKNHSGYFCFSLKLYLLESPWKSRTFLILCTEYAKYFQFLWRCDLTVTSNHNHFVTSISVSAWSCTCSSHAGSHIPPDPLYPTCQQPEVFASCFLYQGTLLPVRLYWVN